MSSPMILTDFTIAQKNWIKAAAAINDITVQELLGLYAKEQLVADIADVEWQNRLKMMWKMERNYDQSVYKTKGHKP